MKRRQFMLGLSALAAGGLAYAVRPYWPADLFQTGIENQCPSGLPESLLAHPLHRQVWQGIDPARVWDCHVHIAGTGDSRSGVWFSPDMDSYRHPILKLQKHFYMNGGCVDEQHADASYATRLVELMAGMPPGCKAMLYAFEWFHDEQGRADRHRSIFHIPNAYAAAMAKAHPDIFEWVASIHPFRADCVDALQQAKAQGAKAIKWLPTAMGIDPLSPQCDRFYRAAAGLKLPIISHTGRESAVQGGNQDHANPLRLRRALDHGVKVALAHCASDGSDIDLDRGAAGPRVSSFELFTRMLDEPDHAALLVGEISAITLRNHEWVIKPLLSRTEWHGRLINGSDYPLPAIMPLTDVASLARAGLLDSDAIPYLQQLKQHNALLYDFALKRLLRYQGQRFPTSVFETRTLFES